MIQNILYQIHQFGKPFPDPNSMAFKFIEIIFNFQSWFDRLLGRKIDRLDKDDSIMLCMEEKNMDICSGCQKLFNESEIINKAYHFCKDCDDDRKLEI